MLLFRSVFHGLIFGLLKAGPDAAPSHSEVKILDPITKVLIRSFANLFPLRTFEAKAGAYRRKKLKLCPLLCPGLLEQIFFSPHE